MNSTRGTNEVFDYSLFGLRVRSSLELPELFPASGEGEPDVTIDVASLGSEGPRHEGLRPANGALVLAIPDVGRFQISGGNRILVDPERDTPERNVRLYLLGSAFGVLLHQRGLLPLHANAVEIDGRAVAFMGESGAGKSTLAAWFHDSGYRVISDDVCVVGFDEQGDPYAVPGLPRLRLWAEALDLMGHGAHSYPRSYLGEYDKFDLPIAAANAATTNIPLTALYLLDRGEDFAITELRGVEAAEVVFANTYRGGYVSAVGGNESHMRSAVRLVRSLPVLRASRRWELSSLDQQCRQILDHVNRTLARAD